MQKHVVYLILATLLIVCTSTIYSVNFSVNTSIPDQGKYMYSEKSLHDKDIATAWCFKEGRKAVLIIQDASSSGFFLINGLAKNIDLYHKNGRLKNIHARIQ